MAIRNAAFPHITRQGVYALRQGRGSEVTEVLFKPTSGPLRTIHTLPVQDEVITGFAANDESWIVTQRRGDKTAALVWHGGEPDQIVGAPGENFGYPVLGTGFAAWAESSGAASPLGAYVYPFTTGRTYQAGNRAGLYGLEAAGRHIAWQIDTTRNTADPDSTRWVWGQVVN